MKAATETSAHEPTPGASVTERLRKQLEAHPYQTLGFAVGLGALLGYPRSRSLVSLFATRLGRSIAGALLAGLLSERFGNGRGD